MIKVDGGFAKIVNAISTFEDKGTVETKVFVKLNCADSRAEQELSRLLRDHGFYGDSDNGTMMKTIISDPFGGVS